MLKKVKDWALKLYYTPVEEFHGVKKKAYRFIKLLILSVQSFIKDKCILRASALTFYTLMSIVPIIAMSFAIAKGFGMQAKVESELISRFQEHEDVIKQIIVFSKNLLENTKGGLIAGIGTVVLFWSVVKVINHVEGAFNSIWYVKKQRNWKRKFTDFFTIMFIGPIVFFVASSVTVFIVSKLEAYVKGIGLYESVSSSIIFLIQLTPYALIWALFTFIYIFMPNTKVKFLSALVGALIAGTVYQVVQWGYFKFQISASKYGAIYGSFAAIPLFLVWLQLSWIIVLAGSEISCAWQNFEIYAREGKDKPLSHRLKILLSLWVTHLCVKKVQNNEGPITLNQIYKQTKIPLFILNSILNDLVDCHILVFTENEKSGYMPEKTLLELKVKDVIDQLENYGLKDIPNTEYEMNQKFMEIMDSFSKAVASSPNNILLKDL
ncbi:MAG: YihY/virulence factor BrkB family protein [Chlamydiae bacterium CG10_big_fil_rev_8_21_14_0_10_35_9]|nr:MAG: YihY/virulence factor BrkB family protein [Chlamydiae bacterium CG10_big_fil_rev_8_21_14_0_10_35_9]